MKPDTRTERGQIGIGTLIVFIAMVLVAAVAAGVLINTAGLLQSSASDTSDDAQSQVSNQVDVVSATGTVGSSSDGIHQVTLVVKKSSGSEDIDLTDMTVNYQSKSASKTLNYSGSGNDATADSFNTSQVGTGPTDVLSSTDERVKVGVNVGAIETGVLSEGDEVTLRLVDQSGAATVYGVNVPDTISSGEEVVGV